MKRTASKGKCLPFCFLLFSALFLSIFSWSTSPFYMTYGGDSPFFQIIGLGITQGKIPYVDLFDHKGPVPFFINALGYSFGIGRHGIFILQILFMTATLSLLYSTARLFVQSGKKALVAVALSMLPLIDFITEGNQVEEWELPFVGLSLFLTCRHLLNSGEGCDESGHMGTWQSAVVGICFSIVFLIRPNDGVMWIGSIFFGLFLLWISRREYKQLLANVLAFIGGSILPVIPVLWYFGTHNAIGDLWYGMITHNIRYAGDALFTWGGIGMIIIPAIIVTASIMFAEKQGCKGFKTVFIPMLILTVLLIGKRDYYHYLIPLVPFITMCFALCIASGKAKAFLWTVCLLFAIFSYQEFRFILKAASKTEVLKEFYKQSDALFDNVPEGERNQVWNYNLVSWTGEPWPHMISMMGCFLHKGITPSGAVLAAYDLQYLEDIHGVRAREPQWLVMCPSDPYNKDFDYIEANYEPVASSPAEPVCELRLYRRKN